VLLLDVTPLSLGIETMGGVMNKIITKNSTIPTKQSQIFSTAEDNQPAVTIKVHQGEREIAKHNKLLGEFNLEGIPNAPRGTPQIEVSFDINADGILKVSAKDKQTGKENDITIKANSGLTEGEIERMVQEAEANADSDKKARTLIETRNTVEHQIWGVEKNLKEHGDKLLDEQKADVEAALAELREALQGDDADKIQEVLQSTMPKLIPLLEISQKSASEEPVHEEPPVEEPTGKKARKKKSDTVVDAEFTEVKN
jgi:molecular chaperone DnaK